MPEPGRGEDRELRPETLVWGEADEVLGTRTDGRIAHVFPHGQFEGLLNIAIGIESANGEEPDYDITTEENRMLIEISHSSR
ncbi:MULTISPECIES: hypothetical protein [unclassified Streptomyces]|uniref:hypothetical protein n=1 Tax=unclassified Streptomyces TaxID=2593676 RepID=UPI0011B0629C|nr:MULTISPECIES: hypothetical protein [unclassified Streptomyces]